MVSRSVANEARWGFCPTCTLWRLSASWLEPGSTRPRCPHCGDEPDPLETVEEGGIGRVHLVLELPPGGDLPLLS